MLKDHYLLEDWPAVLTEIENLLNVSTQVLGIVENAEFSSNNEQLAQIKGSLEVLQTYNRKKVNRDVDDQAYAIIRRNYF